MTERIKKHWDLVLVFGVGLVLVTIGLLGMIGTEPSRNYVSAATGDVEVTATVQEWLTFSVSPTSTDLGDLLDAVGTLHIGSSTDITLTVSTNSSDGYNIDIKDSQNGIASGTTIIQLAAATDTIATGTDGYGVQATSTHMTVANNYSFATSTNDVGRITAVNADLASENAAGTNRVAYIKIKAACDDAQPAGTYTDVITLTTLPTP